MIWSYCSNPFMPHLMHSTATFVLCVAAFERWVNVRGYELPAEHQFVMCIIDISAWKIDQSTYRHAAEHDELTGWIGPTSRRRWTSWSRTPIGCFPLRC